MPQLSKSFPKETSLAVFKKICTIRSFELQAKAASDAQRIHSMPMYLSVGQESISSALSETYRAPRIFAQHRCHDVYLAYGGDPRALIDELLHRPTGCAKGMGGSASIHSPAIGMFGHSGLMGDQIPIAVGYALGSGNPTLAIMGDASAEEDYVLGALGYAATKKAPVLFVCIDNGLSILTMVSVRRNWTMAAVAAAFGMPAVEITDDPWLIMHHAQKLRQTLPAFMNIHTCRILWHAGTGNDGPPEWDRYTMVKGELASCGWAQEITHIEEEAAAAAQQLWEQGLSLE